MVMGHAGGVVAWVLSCCVCADSEDCRTGRRQGREEQSEDLPGPWWATAVSSGAGLSGCKRCFARQWPAEQLQSRVRCRLMTRCGQVAGFPPHAGDGRPACPVRASHLSHVHNKRERATTTVVAQNRDRAPSWPRCSSRLPRCFLACHRKGPPAFTSAAPAVFANSLCRARRKRHLAT